MDADRSAQSPSTPPDPPVAPDGGSELPDTIDVTATAAEKADRYLNPTQLERVLRQETGYVCRKRSPNHEGLYPDDEFLIRGEFCGESLDIAFVVEDDRIVVVTQMSQHADSLRGRFYERIGDSAADAVAYHRSRQ